jgi:hypothetical protein
VLSSSAIFLTFCRALQVALRTLLEKTKKIEVDGEMEFARMPEMGIISCPVKLEV